MYYVRAWRPLTRIAFRSPTRGHHIYVSLPSELPANALEMLERPSLEQPCFVVVSVFRKQSREGTISLEPRELFHTKRGVVHWCVHAALWFVRASRDRYCSRYPAPSRNTRRLFFFSSQICMQSTKHQQRTKEIYGSFPVGTFFCFFVFVFLRNAA